MFHFGTGTVLMQLGRASLPASREYDVAAAQQELRPRGWNPCVRFRPWVLHATAAVILVATAGCPQFRDPTVPAPIVTKQEPRTETDYLLYAPSYYDRGKAWPLVVVCHGTKPWDSPLRLIRDWVKLAEDHGFLVAAPHLQGTRGDFPPAAEKQIALQNADEQLILDVVQHVKGAYTISPDRVFLCGWSAGSYAVLHTGLKHPDVFRALAIVKGNFNATYLTSVASQIDPYQPVYVVHSPVDLITGTQGTACVEWLSKHGAALTEESTGSQHSHTPNHAFEFFELVVRQAPWLHIRALRDDRSTPLTIRFKTLGSFEPEQFAWDFGDGHTSPIASPEHTFAEAGTYTITLSATLPRGNKMIKRELVLSLP